MREPRVAKILVVEDNEDNRFLIVKILTREGHETVEAESGEEAVRLSSEVSPDLILMDVELKGMDGLSATTKIKADPATRHIPVVALTAYAMVGDRERAMAAGCDGYLSKPINVRELPRQVGGFLHADGEGE
jgi:CheY-like chemotaxis protein